MGTISIISRKANALDSEGASKAFTENQLSKIELHARGEAVGFSITAASCVYYVAFEHGTTKGQ